MFEVQGFTQKRRSDEENRKPAYKSPLVDEMHQAELAIIKPLQQAAFGEEIKILHSLHLYGDVTDRTLAKSRNMSMKKTSSLFRPNPFLDENGVLRVGG